MTLKNQHNFTLENNTIYTNETGTELLHNAILNKDTAFSHQERETFALDGLLPPHIDTLEEQEARCYQAFSEKVNALQKHIYLRQLQDQNETLFYRLVVNHLEEMMPVIYTPTVGDACMQFSHIYRRARGLFISYPEKDKIHQILDNAPLDDVKVIVVTDGERILGLGDQGAGGMGIPIGKLSLYTACGGIDPMNTLPIILDVGTNNKELQDDPTYIGWRHERVTGDDYYAFVDQFVQAVAEKYPHVLLQFEDFAQPHAYPLLEKYRDKLCTFNDDIQGTASVCVGAILAAVKASGNKLGDHKIAVLGAGSAGCGISEQLVRAMMREGVDEAEARSRFYMVDRYGLLLDNDSSVQPFQKGLLQPHETVSDWTLEKSGTISLFDVMQNAQPSILLGVSGQPNQFTEAIVKKMAEHAQRPIIFPMSNPTSRCEAQPVDLIKWTEGRAIVATGSPFEDVQFQGKAYPIAQSNNCYIFPGVGLGVLAVGAKRVSDAMFMAASVALSEASPLVNGTGVDLLPALHNIRAVSQHIAFAVAKQAQADGYADAVTDDVLQQRIEETMWEPQYYDMAFR